MSTAAAARHNAEGSGRSSRRLRRTNGQTEECQARAYLLRTAGALTFDKIAATPDPTGTGPSLYANAAAARQAYLAHAERIHGVTAASKLTVTERRALHDDRYERILQTWLPRALDGSQDATMLCLRAMRDQQELHGIKMRASAPEADEGPEDVADELADRRAQSRAEARAAALRTPAPDPTAPPPTE